MPRTTLTEARPVAEATPVAGQPGRFLVQLINPGWGASGYYSPQVLEAAAKRGIFAAGTHMYLDHPTESEEYERPERSVRDLSAVLAENARWDGNALVAEATVFGPYREVLSQMAESIGVSIRAAAEVTDGGVAEGRKGRIIDELVEGISADFVTHAGRGGRIVQVLESARNIAEARNIGQWVESRIHRDFTILADDMAGDGRLTREERIGLSSAIGDALVAFVANLEANQPQLYQRDLWDDPQDTIAAAIEAAKNVPVTRPGSTTTTESQEDTMPNIEEAELSQLREASGRVPTLEAERDTAVQERDAARTERDRLRAQEAARTRARSRVTETNGNLPAATVDRIIAAATLTVPLTEAGQLDEAAFDAATDAARTAEETYLAGLAEAAGMGDVRGFGGGSTPTTGLSEAEFNTALGIKIGA